MSFYEIFKKDELNDGKIKDLKIYSIKEESHN
jgi:hypothetical protein